jgi:hypothetical protein
LLQSAPAEEKKRWDGTFTTS